MAAGTLGSQAPYVRVAAAIRVRIADGTWPPGCKLPSRTALGREFDVGENVVRRAQELLITQGLLEGRAGSGTYVRERQRRRSILRTRSVAQHLDNPYRSEMAALGLSGTWEADSTAKVPAPDAIAARLAIEPGSPCVCTTYEFLADRQPVMLSSSWEPMAITGGTIVVLPEGGPLAGRGVVARMREIGVTVARVLETPRPVQLDRDQAHRLGVAVGSPAISIERVHFDTEGRPVETADILVPAERWDVSYEIPLLS